MLGEVLGSDHEFHFVQPALSHARTKRSIGHHAKLHNDDDVIHVEQLTGYKRAKRGYRPLAERLQSQFDFSPVQSPTDPLYNYQWYLNAEASYDFSSNDPFPYPRYTDDWFNSHGTR
ncbi:hypothetical protein NECAME_12954 [Necator americanus]|uniref:Peptidase S8 pro-domain domain-containing protein n=1 Tax=Necator americanus TaxID=51031 RepID=W2SXV9_NECAM|nr:hypothetical protein NECAME_12954 [Necator americanus]ETN74470.1 hypothetical protein NECAME_12954 [Necator americanus]